MGSGDQKARQLGGLGVKPPTAGAVWRFL